MPATGVRSSALMAAAVATLWSTTAAAAPLERELHFVVTVDAEQDWKKSDPKHPGNQWSKGTTRQRWEVRTRLRSDGKLEVRNLLDPDLNARMEAKTIFLARQARRLMEQSGRPFKVPHTEAEKTALMQQMQEQIMGCKADQVCTHDLTMQYAALMAAVEFPEALEDDTVPGQYLYFLPFKGCVEESRVTMTMAIDGERFNKDVDHLVTFSERRSADTVNASDGLPLCEHFAAVIDTRDPKQLVRHETIFVPSPEGTTEYTERDHTSRKQEPQPLVGAALNWVNDTLRQAPESGVASATLPISMSLNGNSTWLGLWQGTARVTLQWSFKDVSAQGTPVTQK